MSDAYRDDLEAAKLRVADLEREHEALQARNAELEAPPVPPPSPPSAHDLRVRRVRRVMGTIAAVLAATTAVGLALGLDNLAMYSTLVLVAPIKLWLYLYFRLTWDPAHRAKPLSAGRLGRPLSPAFMRGLGIAGLVALVGCGIAAIALMNTGHTGAAVIVGMIIPVFGGLAVLFAVAAARSIHSDRHRS
ncbi:MAG: bZIP transcription factor [Deltaproteobacteria bacterium]|nr:bZIP transcription factor [Deltaproteobacteria bacterium]